MNTTGSSSTLTRVRGSAVSYGWCDNVTSSPRTARLRRVVSKTASSSSKPIACRVSTTRESQ
jgi:hypothetical protein